MTPTTPIEQIAIMLTDAGFRSLGASLSVAGLTFEFPAIFVGTPPSPDLVIVVDTAVEAPQRLVGRIEGLARALDVVGSRRPLTAVLAGPRPATSVLEALTKVCRVLPVNTMLEASDADLLIGLRNWLAVLLPLDIPTPARQLADPISEVSSRTADLDPGVVALIKVADRGTVAVRHRFHELIDSTLRPDTGRG